MKRISYILLSAFAAVAMASCSQVDIDLFDSPVQDGGAGTVQLAASTVSALDFAWQPVESVYQYGYRLLDPNDRVVRQGVTSQTSVRLEKLEESTTYTFALEAYGFNGEVTYAYKTTGTTQTIVKLADPDIEKVTLSIEDNNSILNWEPVENAAYYIYVVTNSSDKLIAEGETQETELNLGVLPVNSYELKLTAANDDEAFINSETMTYQFEIERPVVATYSGTYTSADLGTSFNCELKLFEGGVYCIESFYGVEGYNLEFTINGDGEVAIVNAYSSTGSYRYVETGLEAPNDVLTIYEDPNYTTYTRLPTGKRLSLCVFLGEALSYSTDTFRWKE